MNKFVIKECDDNFDADSSFSALSLSQDMDPAQIKDQDKAYPGNTLLWQNS